MSDGSDGFWAGMFATVIIAFLMIGVATMQVWIGGDCANYGKTSIKEKWYECKPIPEKK